MNHFSLSLPARLAASIMLVSVAGCGGGEEGGSSTSAAVVTLATSNSATGGTNSTGSGSTSAAVVTPAATPEQPSLASSVIGAVSDTIGAVANVAQSTVSTVVETASNMADATSKAIGSVVGGAASAGTIIPTSNLGAAPASTPPAAGSGGAVTTSAQTKTGTATTSGSTADMPAATSVPPITIALTDGTYTISAANKRQPFNQTDRYEVPLKDGLVFVLLDTPSLGHASYIIERRKAGVYGAPLPLLNYAVTITDPRYGFVNAQTVTEHGQWQRWRVQNKPWPFVGITEPELVFGVDPRAKTVTEKLVPEPTPLFTGNLTKAMATTGLRNDIGVYTGWLAHAIRTNSFDNALRNAEAAASIPWHVRDDNGKIVLLSGPENRHRQMRTYYGTHSKPEDTIDENSGWSMDTAHMPKAAWTGYVVNSQNPDPYMIEELQFEAAALMNQQSALYKTSTGLMIARGQGRDYAWGMVSLVHALRATPAAVPDWLLTREQLKAIIEPNLALGVELTKQAPGFDMLSISVGKTTPSKELDKIGTQSSIIHYVPFAMAHCYRLLGDERFMQIGRAHMDRRWAKQIKASPRYMALYAPTTIGIGDNWRYFTSWDEAYSLRGLVSNESTPWAAWTKPTGDEVDPKTGEVLSAYHGNSSSMALVAATLYRDMGFSTPDIDWMTTFLEAKRGTAGLYLEEQFAVKK